MKLTGLLEVYDAVPAYRQLLATVAGDVVSEPLGLLPSARPSLVARLAYDLRRPLLLLIGRIEHVPIWQQALEAWLPDEIHLLRLPEPTPLPFERGPWSDFSRRNRLRVLASLMAGQHPLLPATQDPLIILASARAVLHKTLPRRRFLAAMSVVRAGQVVDMERMLARWADAGYQAVSVVEAQGQFSRRGGIVDVYPLGAALPARIELFGDEVETIRQFDPSTQRSSDVAAGMTSFVIVPPAREVLPGDARTLGDTLITAEVQAATLPGWQDDVKDLQDGLASPHLEYYLPLVYRQAASLFDYLPEQAAIVVDDLAELAQATADVLRHAAQIAAEQESLPPDYPSPLFDWSDLEGRLATRTTIVLGGRDEQDAAAISPLAEAFQPGPRYGGQTRPLMLQLRRAVTTQEPTVIISRQAQRLAELWREELGSGSQNGAAIEPVENLASLPPPGRLIFVQGSQAGGFIVEREEGPARPGRGERQAGVILNVLTDDEVFGWSRPVPRRRTTARPVAPEAYFADINPGDFVVHNEFGIGQFEGLVVRAIGGMDREYLKVTFANADVLYVPVHHADRLSRWIGPDDRSPSLHRLGEKAWRRARAKAQEDIDQLADDLLDLYAARETIAGHGFAADTQWQAELEASFPYRETEDQLQAIAEVKGDMERPYPMDRLICGDVGYGKTEVALRAAFKAVMDGKQVAMLVPTTVLAQQHFDSFAERLRPFPVVVEMLSRFRTASQQERILKDLREGRVDIVIGTHRLFSDDVAFKDLGLLIIDEEQRFGVAHKEKLKQLRTEVDVLTLTATPIPRTLYLSLAGVRDISVIDTAPADRLPVQTFLGEEDDTLLRRAILRELDRGGQVFYVHNRVQTIGNVYIKLSHLVPDARIAIGHGQMSERELEDVMVAFVRGEVDILLSTSIIESGLDIPNANTLIVDRADQFGLAQLYQLRGRVGRGTRQAFAYFFHPPWHRLTAEAEARLEVMASQTELGAGYTIALRDLEIRGAGEILGSQQSGHIAAIGFDLYTRLLAQAVKRRKAEREGEPLPPEPPDAVLIDLPLAAYVPTDYVPDASLRLRLYRRMAGMASLAEIDEMAAELADRFGSIPDPVDNLLYQLRIKVLAGRAGIPAVTTETGQIRIHLPEESYFGRNFLQEHLDASVRVSRKAIWLGRELSTHEWQVILVQILERLQALLEDSKVVAPGSSERL